MLRLLSALALSVCFFYGSAQPDAAAYVDKYAHTYVAPSECDAISGKGILEKYGSESQLKWNQYCNHDKNQSWLKCAGNGNDYLCLGASVGLKVSELGHTNVLKLMRQEMEHTKDKEARDHVALAISGCSWTAGEDNIILYPGEAGNLELAPNSDKESCTPLNTHKGQYLVMNLLDGWNPSLAMNQVLMAFATLAKLGVRPDQVRVVRVPPSSSHCEDVAGCSPWTVDVLKKAHCRKCLDAPWKTHMGGFIERVLSRGGPALDLHEQSHCLENAIFPPPPWQSFLWAHRGSEDARAEKCSHSPMLLGLADYVKDAFAVKHGELLGAGAKLRITIPLRKPSKHHPGHYYREMTNEDQLEKALQKTFLVDRHSHTNKETEAAMEALVERLTSELRSTGEFEVHEVVPPEMTIDDQVQVFSNTDLIIAPHGASLAWQVLQPECSQAIEFCTPGDFPFKNMAHYMGKKHTCIQGPAQWGAESFTADVKETLAKVKAIKEDWLECRKVNRK